MEFASREACRALIDDGAETPAASPFRAQAIVYQTLKNLHLKTERPQEKISRKGVLLCCTQV